MLTAAIIKVYSTLGYMLFPPKLRYALSPKDNIGKHFQIHIRPLDAFLEYLMKYITFLETCFNIYIRHKNMSIGITCLFYAKILKIVNFSAGKNFFDDCL